MSTQIQKANEHSLPAFDLNAALPNLSEAKVINADLTSEYWTPSQVGEEKRCFFQGIEQANYTDEKTGEVIELPCVVLIAQDEKGNAKTIRNGSKRLVATFEAKVNEGIIQRGTAILIVYNGKEKNIKNSYMSDRWSIKPLILG